MLINANYIAASYTVTTNHRIAPSSNLAYVRKVQTVLFSIQMSVALTY